MDYIVIELFEFNVYFKLSRKSSVRKADEDSSRKVLDYILGDIFRNGISNLGDIARIKKVMLTQNKMIISGDINKSFDIYNDLFDKYVAMIKL